MMPSIFALISLWLAIISCEAHPFVQNKGSLFANRGGSSATTITAQKTRSRLVSVGEIKIVGDGGSATLQCKALLHSPTGETLESILPNDASESLATISDLLVFRLVESEGNRIHPSLIEAIIQATERRRHGGFPKLSILVVLEPDTTTDSEGVKLWRERVINQDLQQITPNIVQSLDIITKSDDVDSILEDIISDQTEQLVDDADSFTALLNQVYQSLTRKGGTELEFVSTDKIDRNETILDDLPLAEEDIVVELTPAKGEEEKEEEEISLPIDTSPKEAVLGTNTQEEHDFVNAILEKALDQIDRLEAQQEDVWLNVQTQVPILHFGPEADKILEEASAALGSVSTKVDLLSRLALQIKSLYLDQLQSLREFYGRKYEEILTEKPGDEKALANAAERFTGAFRSAAQNSIPNMCRSGQPLVDVDFSYLSALQGLINDMMEITSLHQDLDSGLVNDEEDGESQRPVKTWYRRLASRAVMLGINYLQGWLAYQGIRRAAAKRDKDMPKFPLF